MKKQLLSLLVAFTMASNAQDHVRPCGNDNQFNLSTSVSVVKEASNNNQAALKIKHEQALNKENHTDAVAIDASANKGTSTQYAGDVIIDNSVLDQRNVKISAAFNGWLYSVFTTSNTTTGASGINISRSKNNGVSWTSIKSFTAANTKYPAIDIVVAGTDTNNLTLFITGVNLNTSTGNYVLWFDKYNATTGTFLGNFGNNISYGTRKVYDVSIASDYRFPAFGTTPYGVGVLYSVFSGLDSVIFVASTNGGTSLNVRQALFSTGAYCRKVSLAYGRSATYSNGRYFAAWERCSSSTVRNANIYTSHCVTTINGTWNAPKNLDSLDANMLGVCRNPNIAVQYNNTNNDSGNVTAAVTFERDWGGAGTDYDILGFYNKQAASNNYWKRFDIINTADNDNSPDLVYDPGANNFLAVYHDSTNHKLPYCVNNMNMTNPNTWSYITTQYNDLTTNILRPWPRIDINPVTVKAVHVWNSEGTGKGIALFDAENLSTSIKEVTEGSISGTVYPNPATTFVNLNFELKNVQDVAMDIYDALGNIVKHQVFSGVGNSAELKTIDIADLADGVYVLKLSSEKVVFSKKLVKAAN